MKFEIGKQTVRGKIRHVVDLRKPVAQPDGKIKWIGPRHFFTSEEKAEAFIKKIKGQLKLPEPVIMTEPERRDWLAASDIKKRLGNVTWTELATYYFRHHKPVEKKEFTPALAQFLAAKRNTAKDDYYVDVLESRLDSLQNYCKERGRKFVDEITHSDVDAWIHSRGWAAVTKRGALIDIQTFFNFCKKENWCHSNPVASMEKIEVGEFAKGILTPEQTEIALEVITVNEPKLTRYFVDQIFGGLRESESAAIKKTDEKAGFLEFVRKTGEMGFVEFNDTWTSWRTAFESEYFPINRLKKRVEGIRKKIVKALREKAGFTDTKLPKNCFRHSFCSYGAKLWGPGRAAELAGHSEAMQKKHYRRPIPLEEAKKFWAILPK